MIEDVALWLPQDHRRCALLVFYILLSRRIVATSAGDVPPNTSYLAEPQSLYTRVTSLGDTHGGPEPHIFATMCSSGIIGLLSSYKFRHNLFIMDGVHQMPMCDQILKPPGLHEMLLPTTRCTF